jgi:Polysaccharide pyruvyl transferase
MSHGDKIMACESGFRVALFNDTSHDNHFGCSLVINEIDRRLTTREAVIVWRHHVEQDWRNLAGLPKRNSGIDLAIINGEGTIHHTTEWHRALTLTKLGPYLKNNGIPAFLINAGIHDIDEQAADNLRFFDKIFVRDTYSKAQLAAYGIGSEVVVDLTMSACLPTNGSRNGILGTDSVIESVAQLIRSRAAKDYWDYAPILFEPVYPGVKSTAIEYASLLSSCELVVTGRFHVLAMCLATETPVIAIESRTPKLSSLLFDVFASTRRLITSESLSKIEIESYKSWRTAEISSLRAFLSDLRLSTDAMFNEIFNYINRC